jgi:hypothetical protein
MFFAEEPMLVIELIRLWSHCMIFIATPVRTKPSG